MLRLLFVLFIIPSTSFGIHYTMDNSPYYIDETILITEEQTISIDPGVTFYLAPEVEIIIYGNTDITGNSTQIISFLPQEPTIGWGKIKLFNNSHRLEYIFIQDGVLWSDDSELYLSNIHINNTQDLPYTIPFILSLSGFTSVDNCLLEGVNKGEGILIFDQEKTDIKNTTIVAIPDAIEINNTHFAVIHNNTLLNMDDDAIDLNNCHHTTISRNHIQGASDRGVEIGSQNFGSSTDIVLKNNIIINCAEGINVKEGSDCLVRNNTFFQNGISAVAIEDIPNSGGSSLIIENSIFSESGSSDIYSDQLSSILVNYSLSDQQIIEGKNNLYGDPLFNNSSSLDLSLNRNSPAIDSGDPRLTYDDDCTVSDLGALFFDQCNGPCTCDLEVIIYPNPFSNSLTFRPNKIISNEVKIIIFNSIGFQIKETTFRNVGSKQLDWFNLDLLQGFYIVKVIDGDRVFTKKICSSD